MDLLFVADYSMFEKFVLLYKGDEDRAAIGLTDYLRLLFSELSVIYSRFRFFGEQKLELWLSGVLVIRREEDCPFFSLPDYLNETLEFEDAFSSNISSISTKGIDSLLAIHGIHSWLFDHSADLPNYDHVVVITQRDLLSQQNESSTQGMAYVRSMCRKWESASVIEDVGALSTAVIVAHEIGHSLGSFHDGSGNSSDCEGKWNYLMSPTTSGNEHNDRFSNSFLLSNCSISQIEEFLESSDSICLQKSIIEKPKEETKIQPFGLSFQCRIAFGADYGFCLQREFSHRRIDRCRRLWCQNRSAKRSNCETKAFLPLMDGSDCGIGHSCLSGNCVPNESKKECSDLRSGYCSKYSSFPLRSGCSLRHIRQICCLTCSQYEEKKRTKYINSDL